MKAEYSKDEQLRRNQVLRAKEEAEALRKTLAKIKKDNKNAKRN